MRRPLIVLAATALAASTLAFAPSVATQPAAATDQSVVFTESGSQTVTGSATGAGANLLGGCTTSPEAYCETVLVQVDQPVVDEDPEATEIGSGRFSLGLTPPAPGPDYDVAVFPADADGTATGGEIASSGNFPACGTICGPTAGAIGPDCGGPDECLDFAITTLEGTTGTKFYRVEVYYYLAAGPWSMDLTYERTDGRNADGTTGTTGTTGGDGTGDATGAADAVAPIDVTGGFEKVGDWGGGGNNAAVGDALGQDLESAHIGYADDTFTFVIDLVSLPPVGGTPEATRYGWSFRYNDLELELDGKFTNYSRGTCDPTAGTCPPPRDPGLNQFLLRGNCRADTSLPMTLTLCEEFANVQATFDPADGTITIPIPAAALAPDGVQACDEIVGLNSFIGQSVWSAPSAFITNTAMPYDDALHYIPLVVPHADPALSCGA